MRPAALLACVLLLVTSCRGAKLERVVRLLQHPDLQQVPGARAGVGWRVEEGDDGRLRIHESFATEAIETTPWPGIYSVSLAFPFPAASLEQGDPYALTAGGETFAYLDVGAGISSPTEVRAGSFAVAQARAYFKLREVHPAVEHGRVESAAGPSRVRGLPRMRTIVERSVIRDTSRRRAPHTLHRRASTPRTHPGVQRESVHLRTQRTPHEGRSVSAE